MHLFTGLTFLLSQKQPRSCEFSFRLEGPYGYVASIYVNPAYLFQVPGHGQTTAESLPFLKGNILPCYGEWNTHGSVMETQLKQE